MKGWQHVGGIMPALSYVEASLDSEDDALAIARPSNMELMQALVVLSSAYSGGMTLAKIRTDLISCMLKAMQQTIDNFFHTNASTYKYE